MEQIQGMHTQTSFLTNEFCILILSSTKSAYLSGRGVINARILVSPICAKSGQIKYSDVTEFDASLA